MHFNRCLNIQCVSNVIHFIQFSNLTALQSGSCWVAFSGYYKCINEMKIIAEPTTGHKLIYSACIQLGELRCPSYFTVFGLSSLHSSFIRSFQNVNVTFLFHNHTLEVNVVVFSVHFHFLLFLYFVSWLIQLFCFVSFLNLTPLALLFSPAWLPPTPCSTSVCTFIYNLV